MRLHALSLSAFGPFPGAETIDLDEVTRDGLFLLWGATGSGKTTVLDAVVFALYGTVPGVRGEQKRLRSDHASARTPTEVSCELTLSGERLRIIRRPEQSRPKKRGAGQTSDPARLTVQRSGAGGWEPVSTRIDEGSEYLRTRLGLDVHQFCQVVLLPQGNFARFLLAEPEDRADLLRTLFDVERFARVEDWLAARRRTAEAAVEQQRGLLTTLLARVAQAAGEVVPEQLAPELTGVHRSAGRGSVVHDWVARVRARAAADRIATQQAAEAAAADASAGTATLATARALDDRHVRRARAETARRRLAAGAAELAPLRDRLDAAARAEALRPALESAGRADHDADRAAAVLGTATRSWDGVAEGRPASAGLARELRDAAAQARALQPEASRAAELARLLADLATGSTRLADRCAATEAAAVTFGQRLADVQARVDAAAAAAAALPGLRAAADAARDGSDAGQRLDGLTAEVVRLRAAAAGARESWLAAREELVDLRARRLDGMAAELAAALADGAACPVCGAAEHPLPARSTAPRVSAADEARARVAADTAERAATAAAGRIEEVDRELAELRGRTRGRPLAELTADAARTAEAVRAARPAAEDLDAARHELATLTAEQAASARRLADDRAELGRRAAEHSAHSAELAALEARLAAVRGPDVDLETRAARLTAVARRCEEVIEARAAHERARLAADAGRRSIEQQAAAAGFADSRDAAGALWDRPAAAAAAQRLAAHERESAAVQGVLADPELTDLPPRPDLPALEAACARLTAAREGAVSALDRAERRVADLDGLAGDVVAAEVALHEARAAADQVVALAELANGRGANTFRMRLQSFVLAARLEEVAEVASERLLQMSASRYTFRHSDVSGRHGARGGLGLDVFDAYTGTLRPTKTLSGGESFMASLALALGLADVVTAESGGLQMDTLFVDEGFGSLDAAALDAVMAVLDDLRRGGRTVGVVSHVEELRTRIPVRLEITGGRSGSHLAG